MLLFAKTRYCCRLLTLDLKYYLSTYCTTLWITASVVCNYDHIPDNYSIGYIEDILVGCYLSVRSRTEDNIYASLQYFQ